MEGDKTEGKSDAQQMFEVAMSGPWPKVYFNTHAIAWTPLDASVLLQANGVPAAVVFASYESWKSFAQALLKGIADIEHRTGVTFGDFETMAKALQDTKA